MARVLIIGAGGVGSVVAHKCAQNPEVFTEIMLASRTVSKCDAIAASIKERTGRIIETARVNADDVPELVALIKRYKPVMVINVALPNQDLTIMDACLEAGVHYMDTANYEPLDVAKFEYKWQWAYQQKFKDAGLMALLGSGFDPGVTNVFAAYAQKHLFDEIHRLQRGRSRAALRYELQPGNQHPRSDRQGPLLGTRRVGGNRSAFVVHDLRFPGRHRAQEVLPHVPRGA